MFRHSVLAFVAGAAVMAPVTSGAQVGVTLARSSAVFECRFELAAGGEPVDYEIVLPGATNVRVQAVWTGGADELALIASRPNSARVLSRVGGRSPLVLELSLPAAGVETGSSIRVSVASRGTAGAARGWILAEGRAPDVQIRSEERLQDRALDPRQPQIGPNRPRTPEPIAPVRPAPACLSVPGAQDASVHQDTIRTVLPDGRTETRYPDGRIVRQGLDSTCWEVSYPDGRRTVLCPYSNVIRAKLADLPPELLGHATMEVWLEDLGPHLMAAIQAIIADPAGLENYTSFERGKSLAERIDLRLRLLNRLLEAR